MSTCKLLPIIKSILSLPDNRSRLGMLRKAPPYVISDIIEVLYNILHINCKLTYYQKKIIMENKKPIVNLLGNSSKTRLKPKA